MKYTTLLILLFSANINAQCLKSYVCDDYGNCGYVDICDSSIDLPSINVPIRPLDNIDVKPPASIAVPPIGTSKCQYMDVNGTWQNVCY